MRSELKGASIESSGAKVGRKHIRGPSDALSTQLLLQKKRLAVRAYSSEEVKKAMQQALGKTEVSFRSEEQKQGVEAVLPGHTPLVVVLPTGGGKSLLFMVPACLVPACLKEPGVTVVVVPFWALLGNMVKRMKEVDIECIEWKAEEVNPSTSVVVSADRTAEGDFMDYASQLNRDKLLRRVIIDECHDVHFERLASKASAAAESTAATVPDHTTYGNAAAVAGKALCTRCIPSLPRTIYELKDKWIK